VALWARAQRLVYVRGVLPPLLPEGGRLSAAFRTLRRLRWWWITRGCECHWHEPFGEVVMAGCPRHD
jgi:hypothetical protein